MTDDYRVTVEFEFLEAVSTLGALRAVIDSAPFGAVPDKLVSAEQKLAMASRLAKRMTLSSRTTGGT